MKKIKLLKTVLIATPIALTPLLANSCSNTNGKGTAWKPIGTGTNIRAKFYVDIFAPIFKTQLNTEKDNINTQSKNPTSRDLDITKLYNTALTMAKTAGGKATNQPVGI